jgi:hypothetical protein
LSEKVALSPSSRGLPQVWSFQHDPPPLKKTTRPSPFPLRKKKEKVEVVVPGAAEQLGV